MYIHLYPLSDHLPTSVTIQTLIKHPVQKDKPIFDNICGRFRPFRLESKNFGDVRLVDIAASHVLQIFHHGVRVLVDWFFITDTNSNVLERHNKSVVCVMPQIDCDDAQEGFK